MRQRRRNITVVYILVFVLVLAFFLSGQMESAPQAQSWPTKPVRMIVPFPAGGTVDIFARIISQKLSENLGQQFVVDNRGGAGGTIGAEAAVNASPDGYTFLVGGPPDLVTTVLLMKGLPYDPARDFASVSLMAQGYNVMEVHPSVPANSIKELIALAKSKPGALNFASAGIGNTSHLCGELLKQMAGIDIVHVPYKGNAAAANDLMAGHVQILFESTIAATPKIQAGKVKALAVTSPKRLALLPNVPTFREAGLPGMEVYVFFAMVAPKKTSKDMVARFNKEIDRVLQHPDVSAKIEKLGFEPVLGSTPEQVDAFLESERAKWKKVIDRANIKIEGS